MNIPIVLIAFSLIAFLGGAWGIGYQFIKKHSPSHLVRFYMLMAAVRCLLIGTAVILFSAITRDHQQTVHFALLLLSLYALMMVITLALTLKHK